MKRVTERRKVGAVWAELFFLLEVVVEVGAEVVLEVEAAVEEGEEEVEEEEALGVGEGVAGSETKT